MYSQLITSLLFSGTALASPLLFARQRENSTTQLINQINVVEKDIAQLNNTLNQFPPDAVLQSPDALLVQVQTDVLGGAINQATAIIDRAAPFDDADSSTIATAVLGLEPQIASLLNNIVAHKPSFESVLFLFDLTQTVENDLKEQQTDAANFGTALTSKLSATFAAAAPLINSQIQGFFTTAIAAYQSCSGVICLPPINF